MMDAYPRIHRQMQERFPLPEGLDDARPRTKEPLVRKLIWRVRTEVAIARFWVTLVREAFRAVRANGGK